MKKTILRITLLIFCINSYSQIKHYTKQGVILNKTDSTAIPYVNIYSDTYKIGTVTNEIGEFLLNIPDTISDKTITINSLGFLTKKISLDKFTNQIYISPSTEILDEIQISTKTPKFEKLVDSIYTNLKKNYSNKRHLLKVFYRQTAIKDSSYLRIIEADIDLQEYGIKKPSDRDRIKVNNYRRSNDKMSSRYKKLWAIASKMFGEKNELVWVNKGNFIKIFSKTKEYSLYHKNILKNYVFDYEYTTSINSDPVYVFTFYKKSLDGIVPLENQQLSRIYINAKDYAVLKFEKVSGYKKGNKFKNFIKDNYYYTKIGDYYYLSSAYKSVIYKNKETKIHKLHTYKVVTNRDDYKKVKRKDAEKINKDFTNKKYKNDSIFWKNYPILPEIPLLEKMKSLIQKEKKLNKQYQDNSNEKE